MHVFGLNLIAQTSQRSTSTVTKSPLPIHPSLRPSPFVVDIYNLHEGCLCTKLLPEATMDPAKLAKLQAAAAANRIGTFLPNFPCLAAYLCN
jgi:hypothetical protein